MMGDGLWAMAFGSREVGTARLDDQLGCPKFFFDLLDTPSMDSRPMHRSIILN
jgi:hypothetical protein